LTIDTANSEKVEFLHRQFVEKLKVLGSIHKTLNWMIHASPFPRTLFLSWLWDWG
jgi:hypothetical protein